MQAVLLCILGFITSLIDDSYFSHNIYNLRRQSKGNSLFAHELEDNSKIKPTIYSHLKHLLCLPVFMALSTFISIVYFIVTCVQFYFATFLEEEYGLTDAESLIAFVAITVLAPTLGLLFGSLVIQIFGGYTCKSSYKAIMSMAFMCLLVVLPFPFVESMLMTICIVSALLFFGAAILPSVIGVTLNKVPKKLTSSANTFIVLQTCVIGYMSSTLAYGVLADYFNESNKRIPFTCVFYLSALGLFLVPYGLFSKSEEKNVEVDKLVI